MRFATGQHPFGCFVQEHPPGGGGKVPINPDCVLSDNPDRVVLRNYEGKIFEYPEAPDGTPLVKPSKEIEEPQLV